MLGCGLQPLRPATSAAVRPLARDEFAVPAQDRVRRHNRGDVAQQSAAQAMAELGETLPLRVIETQALPFQPRLQNAILFPKECDHILLLTVQSAAQHRHHQLKRKHR